MTNRPLFAHVQRVAPRMSSCGFLGASGLQCSVNYPFATHVINILWASGRKEALRGVPKGPCLSRKNPRTHKSKIGTSSLSLSFSLSLSLSLSFLYLSLSLISSSLSHFFLSLSLSFSHLSLSLSSLISLSLSHHSLSLYLSLSLKKTQHPLKARNFMVRWVFQQKEPKNARRP